MLTSAPLPPREGIGFYVWNLSRYLQSAGHSVQIVTRGAARAASCEICSGIPIWRAGFAPLYPFHVHLHSILVNQLLHRIKPGIDLLHTHTPLVRAAAGGLPTLVTVHTALRADIGAIKSAGPFEVLVKLQAPVSFALERELLSAADQVVAVSSSVAGELRESGLRSGPVKVLGNGVDIQTFLPADIKMHSTHPYVLAVGRLAPRKGWMDLVQAAGLVLQERPGVKFLIAGSGPLEGQLRLVIEDRHLSSHILLLGHVSERARLVGLYQGAALFVHPARYEGLPTVLLEAMACGCPAVATAVSGALDVIEDRVNGVLSPARCPTRLAEAILTCLDSPKLRRQLGERARKTIEERFSWDVIGRNYIAEYQQLLLDKLN
jgi:glycosyltransferase involved in cell wall biosynthesis